MLIQALSVCALALASPVATAPVAVNLRVEHAAVPLTVDVPAPRFSWQLQHPARAQSQSGFRIAVSTVPRFSSSLAATSVVVWDSGLVHSNRTAVLYAAGGSAVAQPLESDTDYAWTVQWWNDDGAASEPASSTFSMALLHGESDWHGAQWISSASNGSRNTYRALIPALPSAPSRARLYIAAAGYYRSRINGNSTDEHLLGQQSNFEVRALYDVWDVTLLLQAGCNCLGITVGHGWGSTSHMHPGSAHRTWDRQFIAMLSITDASTGRTTLHPSRATGGDQLTEALQFKAAAGPVKYDDVYDGEAFDGRVATAMRGWDTCTFPAGASWEPTSVPAYTPADFNASMSAHTLQTVVVGEPYTVAPGGVRQPVAAPGSYVFDFVQNMAGIATLRVTGCSAGTVVRLKFGEILWPSNGTVHNQFPGGSGPGGMARMLANYTCSGSESEEYTTQLTSFGFRYIEMTGYPGVPTPSALTAHFVGPDFPRAAQFNSSLALLNELQRSIVATAISNWANDVPSDCPHRERSGYLGDGQSAMESVVTELWSAPGYIKWLRDFRDQQRWTNDTLGHNYNASNPTKGFGHGVVGGAAPSHGAAQMTDTAWEIAVWLVPAFIAEWYDDDRVIRDAYVSARWCMEHWVAVAESTGGWFSFDKYGDFGNTDTPSSLYVATKTQYFYIVALEHQTEFAAVVGNAADAKKYGDLAAAARAQFMARLLNRTSGCFGNCTYVSQIFGLNLAGDASALSAAGWDKVLEQIGPNATSSGRRNRFGGGIVTLKLVYPLFQRFGETALALKTLLRTESPSLGYMMIEPGAQTRTLHEAWNMNHAIEGTWVGSFNHIMTGSPGRWFYTLFVGIDRTPHESGHSKSWSRLWLEPPRDPAVWRQNLTSCSGALQTPAGTVAVSWGVHLSASAATLYAMNATVPVNSRATVVLPTVAAAAHVIIFDSATAAPIWDNGTFYPRSEGITGGKVGDDGRSVVFQVGSGGYHFTVAEQP